MIGKVLNKQIAICFWVGRDSDGECHVFNEEPFVVRKGNKVEWRTEEGEPAWDWADTDLFSCVQPGCLYMVTMNFKLKNCNEENYPLLMA